MGEIHLTAERATASDWTLVETLRSLRLTLSRHGIEFVDTLISEVLECPILEVFS